MRLVEHWRWRYRDAKTGRICRTLFPLTAEQAAQLPEAERIDGTMLIIETEDPDFAETTPRVQQSLAPE